MAINKRIIRSNDEAAVGASFNTVLWTGTGTTNPRTDVGFQPDFVWIKNRTGAFDHILVDSVRGNDSFLSSNDTDAESIRASEEFASFDPNGFTLQTNYLPVNNSSYDYVAWCWKAGGAAVTNTDGTITSQVSANTEAGFSIVSYTGNGLSNQTIGHGLGQTPDVIITKGRANLSTYDSWDVWHKDLTLNYVLFLNNTDAEGFAGVDQRFVTSLNSSDVFGVGPDIYGPNSNTTTKIAYCFAEVAGFSKFGSYSMSTGVQVSVDVGFEPAFVLVKEATRNASWTIIDNKRTLSGDYVARLFADLSNAESTGEQMQITGNTFKINWGTTGNNDNGGTGIYMAFANQF